jgi:predicted nucleic acid-binding protein
MIVVDASVAVKWFLNETFSKDALALLSVDEKLIGPQLAAYEVAGAFVRARRRGDIDDLELEAITDRWTATIDASILYLQYDPKDLQRASALAASIGHPMADCVYLAMAERFNAPLVTADKAFIEKVSSDFPFVNFIAQVSPDLCTSGGER